MSEVRSALDAMRGDDLHAMPETLLLNRTEELVIARNLLDGELARSLQALDGREVTVLECGRQTKSWLIEDQQMGANDARRRIWVARRLPVFPLVAAALAAGDITHENAFVIMTTLEKLSPEWREASEAELVNFARDNDPGMVGALCRELRIRTGADEDSDKAEQAKYDGRWVKLDTTFDGMTAISGMLDPASAAVVTTAITALLTKNTGPEDDRTTGQRTADALTDLARFSLSHADLPDSGGERPTVVVTIPLSELQNGLAAGQLSAARLSERYEIGPATARMLACDAGIIPAVLGGKGEVLDLGRKQRTWTVAQRRAARLRDGGCTWPRCQATLDRCDLHHELYWTHLGETNHDNSLHVCAFHHWLVHHTDWSIRRNDAGQIEVRRT